MFKKVTVLTCVFIMFLFSCFLIFNKREKVEDSLYIETGIENKTFQELLTINFEDNHDLTVGQLLVFFSRLYGNNVSSYEEALKFCNLKGIYLPSDLVYNRDDWEKTWRETVLGNTIFEKVNDDTYAISLIQGYLTIYLNEQGYSLIKQGLIPPQLYFYSPFSGIEDLDIMNLNKKATLGFTFEVLMSIDCELDRKQLLHDIVAQRIELLTGIEEKDWGENEISLYNYYSLSYYGEYSYLKAKGYLDNINVEDLPNSILISDFLVLLNKIIVE